MQEDFTRPRNPQDLLKADPKPSEAYDSLSLVHLTAYSVHWLSVWEIPSTYENISVLNARLFPSKFSLVGFPEMPDAFRTNRSILQMRPKYRGFATSDPRRGVFLTDKGRAEVVKVIAALGVPSFEGRVVPVDHPEMKLGSKSRDRTRNPEQVLTDCRSKLLYRRYKEDRWEDTDVVHLLGLIALYDHTPPSEIRKALRQLRADAQTLADVDFLKFLDSVENRFAAYINRSDTR